MNAQMTSYNLRCIFIARYKIRVTAAKTRSFCLLKTHRAIKYLIKGKLLWLRFFFLWQLYRTSCSHWKRDAMSSRRRRRWGGLAVRSFIKCDTMYKIYLLKLGSSNEWVSLPTLLHFYCSNFLMDLNVVTKGAWARSGRIRMDNTLHCLGPNVSFVQYTHRERVNKHLIRYTHTCSIYTHCFIKLVRMQTLLVLLLWVMSRSPCCHI